MKSPWPLRSKSRFFWTLFLVLAVPTAILILLIATYVRKDLQRQAIEHNSLTARLVAQSVDEEFYYLQRFVENFSHRTKLIEAVNSHDPIILRGKLAEMAYLSAKFSRCFATDMQGNLLADSPFREDLMGKNFAQRDWFKGALASETAYVSEIYQRTNMDKADAVSVAVRVKDPKGGYIAVLAGQLTVDKLAAWLQAVKPLREGLVELFDQHGTPALPKRAEDPRTPRFHEITKGFAGNDGWTWAKDPATGEENLVAYVHISSIGWTIASRQPAAQIFAPIRVLLRTITIFFFVCLLAMGIIGYLFFETISNYDSKRRLSELALARHARELKRSNDELEGMCYSIAHDLRAPLRAMRGFTSALIEDYNGLLDHAGQNYTKRIDESAGRMDELIQDLLDYGKLGHAELPIAIVSLEDIAKDILEPLSEEISKKQATIEIKNPLPRVLANRTILQQVLMNLVSNSLKFVALGVPPKITIAAEIRGDKVRVSVRDNGIGIDPIHHKRIFGVFERLHSYESYPGTGIGLAIVRKGIERMGGSIGLESDVDKGSCFWFELPRA